MLPWCLEHPVMTFILAYFAIQVLSSAITRIIRSSTIKKQGYPPLHCDGDGDFKITIEERKS